MNYRAQGFTQRKPKVSGVYFISAECRRPLSDPANIRQGWDVAQIYFFAGSYSSVHDNSESRAHWMVSTLDGISFTWRPGMWLKGPISPEVVKLPEPPK